MNRQALAAYIYNERARRASALSKGGGGVVYEAETDALVARFTTPPTDARKVVINTLIKALKDGGVWSKLDALYLTAAADAQAARRNWKADANNLTAVSSPTFTADRGYAGNGSSSHLDTNFNPATAAGLYQQNSALIAGWNRTSRAAGISPLVGLSTPIPSGTNIFPCFTGDLSFYRCNDSTEADGLADAVSNGLFAANRSGANDRQAYKNGVSAGTIPSNTSKALVSTNILLLRNIGTYSTDQVAAACIGGSLTAGEHLALHNAINTYLQAVGAV